MISGAPVSSTRVPAAGDCVATVFAAKPCTEPSTRQENPASSSAPFAKTNACPVTAGTVSGGFGAALVVVVEEDDEPSWRPAAYVSVAVVARPTRTSTATR